jgi:beta-glucosidase
MWNRGLEPMVTLHHFSNPLWLVEKGDFNSSIVVDYFQRFTAKVVSVLGDLVPKWVTINEPMVYVFMRYLDGKFPSPSQQGWSGGREAIGNLLRCHAAAYHTIKAQFPEAEVGVAKHTAVFQPQADSGKVANWWAQRIDWLFNEMWLASMQDGRLRWPVGRGRLKGLAGSFDFVGLNYYTRHYVKFPPFGGFLANGGDGVVERDGKYGEVYPAGIYETIRWATKFKKPIFITENGLPDGEDRLRPSFLFTHLREIWRAISFCFPVMGYYHWSLVDNFEWDRGWTQRFGLIEMNPETQERQWRRSGQLYSEICHTRSLTTQMAERYAPELLATMFPG